ncbi:MAG: hypothetical protein H0X65_13280 [Gemmatimonadetes bacterium]|nr:hypothetical protein [Gemmatimonadota bacterium]
MTIVSFYRWAAALPFVVPVLCGLLFFAFAPDGAVITPAAAIFLEVCFVIAMAGAWGVLPYLIYLAVVFGWWRTWTIWRAGARRMLAAALEAEAAANVERFRRANAIWRVTRSSFATGGRLGGGHAAGAGAGPLPRRAHFP